MRASDISRPIFGPQIWAGSAQIAELVASFDFDYVYVEMEHSPYVTFESVANLFRAINVNGKEAWIRVPDQNATTIQKVVELGAAAVIVPHVANAAQAAAVVSATRLPPSGTRGYCPSVRRYAYGQLSRREIDAVSEPLVIGLIEDVATLDDLGAIMATGLDGVFPGLADLSYSAKDPSARGDSFHPEVVAAKDAIIGGAVEHDKLVMVALDSLVPPGGDRLAVMATLFDDGVQIFNLSHEMGMVRQWCTRFCRDVAEHQKLGRNRTAV